VAKEAEPLPRPVSPACALAKARPTNRRRPYEQHRLNQPSRIGGRDSSNRENALRPPRGAPPTAAKRLRQCAPPSASGEARGSGAGSTEVLSVEVEAHAEIRKKRKKSTNKGSGRSSTRQSSDGLRSSFAADLAPSDEEARPALTSSSKLAPFSPPRQQFVELGRRIAVSLEAREPAQERSLGFDCMTHLRRPTPLHTLDERSQQARRGRRPCAPNGQADVQRRRHT